MHRERQRLFRPLFPASVVLLLTVAVPQEGNADSYEWDFANGHFDNVSLVPLGRGAVNLLRPSAEGLHIRLPPGEKVDHVGFSPRFKISGDFQITLTYDVKRWHVPETGYGIGPALFLSTDAEQQPAVEINRLLRPGGKSVYTAYLAKPVDGERKGSVRFFDTQVTRGKLRLERIGPTIRYSVLENPSTEFRVLHEAEFNSADVTLVRAGLKQSDTKTPAEITISHIAITADDLPHLPSEQARTERLYIPRYIPPPAPRSYAWVWQLLTASAILVGFTGWVIRRRRRA